MKLLGVCLVILGALALRYGGISYDRHKTILDLGSLKATTTERKTIPIHPALGAITLIGGLLVLTLPGRRAWP